MHLVRCTNVYFRVRNYFLCEQGLHRNWKAVKEAPSPKIVRLPDISWSKECLSSPSPTISPSPTFHPPATLDGGVWLSVEYQQVLPCKKKKKVERTVARHFHPSYSTLRQCSAFAPERWSLPLTMVSRKYPWACAARGAPNDRRGTRWGQLGLSQENTHVPDFILGVSRT